MRPTTGFTTMFSNFVNRARISLARRSEYNRLVAEIQSMSDRDLADINGNRSEMLHHAYRMVYG